MVKFSCFNPLIHSHKSKKTAPRSSEEIHKSLQDHSQLKSSSNSTESRAHPLVLNMQSNNGNDNVPSSSFMECVRESDQMRNKSHLETNAGVCQYREDLRSEPIQVGSNSINIESIFSIGDSQHLEKECHENCDDHVADSTKITPRTLPTVVKSNSVPEMRSQLPQLVEVSSLLNACPQSRSSEDLLILEMRREENSVHDIKTDGTLEQVRDDRVYKSDKYVGENPVGEAYDSYSYARSAKAWIVPVPDELNMGKNFQGESSVHQMHKLPSEEFRKKRIEEWIIDLQHCRSFEETNETSFSIDQVKGGSNGLNGLTAGKLNANAKVSSSIEASKRYISSLTPATTTAQLANHGLVVVPFLSTFVSLRVLNLSGNAIVRITALALPRGLHLLNLSKNSISTIEGLRELTRLRILDLSYNRIMRIGHGLASCSLLKELYLAGNKISEVEGLHRLLKLNVLDLRFNKISTAKSLGQLAANYNSLQAISLEGNPAQKNVGDDHLKKYLQGLLTHLAYYNRQPVKVVSTSKEVFDRSIRLGANPHQLDHGLRPELKTLRKGTIGVAPQKTAFSSTHDRSKGQAIVSTKISKAKNGKLPPSGPKAPVNHGHRYFDFGSKISSLGKNIAMHRSRSAGNLGAF